MEVSNIVEVDRAAGSPGGGNPKYRRGRASRCGGAPALPGWFRPGSGVEEVRPRVVELGLTSI